MFPVFQWQRMARMAVDTHWVMTVRMMRLAQGGPDAGREARRMISEKFTAAAEAQTAAILALASGATPAVAAARALTPVRRALSANRRRLSHL